MIQKVLKVGSSAAVIIPRRSLQELGLKPGDRVFVQVDYANRQVIVSKRPVRLAKLSKSDRELMKWTQNFICRYGKDLEALVQK